MIIVLPGAVLVVTAQQPAFDFASLESGQEAAIFAGGCFWCMEPPYDALDGVIQTLSGYTGGTLRNPTYRQVVAGGTGHYEAVLVIYDPARVTYEKLLEVFWFNVDPLDAGGQFCDRGDMYRTGIFYRDREQQRLATESKRALDASRRLPRPVVTEIMPARTFYIAETNHQGYYLKSPLSYRTYRIGCGRDARLRQLWGSDAPY
ncbi:MAG: peptide-methionine (S)-S-oxide reductase [Spirochaetaceae bacterium]|nr:MAG: peptide-methionine (S)-S-oxide reductase [Spirochaetaceae bacterium]